MKIRSIGSVSLALLLSAAITACGTEQHPAATASQEASSTTATTESATATATTTTTTSAAAPSSNAKKSTASTVSKTAVSTSASSKAPATSSTTYPKGHPRYQSNPPFEDKSAAPGTDKRRLLFKVNGEEITFSFDAAMRYPLYDDALIWHYTGKTKAGIPVVCKVAAEQNAIFQVAYDVLFDRTVIKEKEARACMKRFLSDHNLSHLADKITLYEDQYMTKGTEDEPSKQVVSWSFVLPTEQENDSIWCRIQSKDGTVYVDSVQGNNTAIVDGIYTELAYCLGTEYDLLIPRWKSE